MADTDSAPADTDTTTAVASAAGLDAVPAVLPVGRATAAAAAVPEAIAVAAVVRVVPAVGGRVRMMATKESGKHRRHTKPAVIPAGFVYFGRRFAAVGNSPAQGLPPRRPRPPPNWTSNG